MKHKCFLFDWDGTLADSLPVWIPEFKQTFEEFGIEISEQEIGEKVIGNWNAPAELGLADPERFFRSVSDRLLPKLPEVQLNHGVIETLNNIKSGGGVMAILTSSKREWVEPALLNLGIRGLFEVFLAKEDVKEHKPSPEMLIKAMEMMETSKSETVMVGDNNKDILAAINAGIDSILYYPKRYERYYRRELQESLGATYVIRDFREISELNKNPA